MSRLHELWDKYEEFRQNNHPNRFELAIASALHDIHRRCIEEPWYGRTVYDVVHNYNSNIDQKLKEYERQARQQPAQQKEPPGDDLEVKPGQEISAEGFYGKEEESGHNYDPSTFYGTNQEQEQQQDQGRDIER